MTPADRDAGGCFWTFRIGAASGKHRRRRTCSPRESRDSKPPMSTVAPAPVVARAPATATAAARPQSQLRSSSASASAPTHAHGTRSRTRTSPTPTAAAQTGLAHPVSSAPFFVRRPSSAAASAASAVASPATYAFTAADESSSATSSASSSYSSSTSTSTSTSAVAAATAAVVATGGTDARHLSHWLWRSAWRRRQPSLCSARRSASRWGALTRTWGDAHLYGVGTGAGPGAGLTGGNGRVRGESSGGRARGEERKDTIADHHGGQRVHEWRQHPQLSRALDRRRAGDSAAWWQPAVRRQRHMQLASDQCRQQREGRG